MLSDQSELRPHLEGEKKQQQKNRLRHTSRATVWNGNDLLFPLINLPPDGVVFACRAGKIFLDQSELRHTRLRHKSCTTIGSSSAFDATADKTSTRWGHVLVQAGLML